MRYVLIGVSIILSVLLQVTIFPSIPYIAVTPNFLLMVTVAFSIMYGQTYGIFIGMICGFLLDIYSGTTLGYCAFIFVCLGYACGTFSKSFSHEDYKLPTVLILSADFVYGAAIYITSFLIGGGISVTSALFYIIIPEIVYTGLVSVFLYPVLVYFDRKVREHSRRRAKKFVAEK